MSSGLFLAKLNSTLGSDNYNELTGSIRSNGINCMCVNYSDDILGVAANAEAIQLLQTTINKQFPVELEIGLPSRWVSCEFKLLDDTLFVTYAATAAGFDAKPIKFTLKALDELVLIDKTDNAYTTLARSSVGKLNYLVNGNPFLSFYVSFLSSALHFDPEKAFLISEALIHASSQYPFKLTYTSDLPCHIVVYTDASHSLRTGRAHSGFLIQLQSENVPSKLNNVIAYGSERLAKLYSSVYSAELKAIEIGIKNLLSIRKSIESVFGLMPITLFCDNKAAVDTLRSNKEVHPFVTDSADIIRQLLNDNSIDVRWVCTEENLADCLTKPKKWF